jgi:hypothetical protein
MRLKRRDAVPTGRAVTRSDDENDTVASEGETSRDRGDDNFAVAMSAPA